MGSQRVGQDWATFTLQRRMHCKNGGKLAEAEHFFKKVNLESFPGLRSDFPPGHEWRKLTFFLVADRGWITKQWCECGGLTSTPWCSRQHVTHQRGSSLLSSGWLLPRGQKVCFGQIWDFKRTVKEILHQNDLFKNVRIWTNCLQKHYTDLTPQTREPWRTGFLPLHHLLLRC